MRHNRFVSVLVVALCCVLALGLTACGGSDFSDDDSNAIGSDISSRLDELKADSGDSVDLVKDTVNTYVGSQLEEMSVSADDLVDAYLQSFDYEISDISGSGGSATCKIKLTCRSVTGIIADFQAKSKGMTPTEAGAVLLQCVKDAPATQQEADAYCQKGSDGSWECLEGLKQALVKLCF